MSFGEVEADDGAIAARAVEAILFLADEPIGSAALARYVGVSRGRAESILQNLSSSMQERRSGLCLRPVAGGWRLYTHPDVASFVEGFVTGSGHARLSRAALETLAIVAYKQPVTRAQIAGVRGVNPDGVLRALVDRELIEEAGRDEGPGRAVLFGTTARFLERLGLASLSDLPPIAPLLQDD